MLKYIILFVVAAALISLFMSILLQYPLKEGMEEIDGDQRAESNVYNPAETLPGRPE